MFTGIIEAKAKIIEIEKAQSSLQVTIERPQTFDDISIGDSIACNGVCLTLEKFDESKMSFTIGFETLKITAWNKETLKSQTLNLERSLKFGDRIHGHLVSGHVDNVTEVVDKRREGECLLLTFKLPEKQRKEIWKKSSVSINGVSLTVNWLENNEFQVCLIPETLRQTNLVDLKMGDPVNLETDYYMKGLLSSQGVIHA